MTFRLLGALAALGLLAACNTPAPVSLVTVADTPGTTPAGAPSAPADPVASAASDAPAQPELPSATPVVPAAPAVGGGGVGGGGSPGGVAGLPQIVLSPDPLTPEVLAIPAGMTGQASVFVPERVPSSIELDGTAVTLHPRVEGAVAEPSGGTATLVGDVASGEPDLLVQYVAKGRTVFVGGRTDGSGAFSVEVPMAPGATESGVLIVRENGQAPRLAIARVTLTDGQSAAAGTLSLASPLPPAAYRVAGFGESTDTSVPRPAAGLAFSGAALQLAESGASGPWRATVLSSSAAGLPSYAWPGFTPVVSYLASAADGLTSSETSGPAGAVPAFLAPPALGSIAATVRPGTVLSWPAVAGAGLYTARLVPVGQEDSPVWEGLVLRPQVTIPTGLAAAAGALTLEVDAWDAPEVTPYSVASLRQLRIPTGPMGPTGRHSWSRRAVTYTP